MNFLNLFSLKKIKVFNPTLTKFCVMEQRHMHLDPLDDNVMEAQGVFDQQDYEAQQQLPFSFRVQPMQPNLQERF